jgi:short-subunit dehydrogenase
MVGKIMKQNLLKSVIFVTLLFSTNFCAAMQKSSKKVKRAIIIGATSGIGRQVAKILANKGGYVVGLVGRRTHLLKSLQKEVKTKSYIKSFDVSKHESAAKELRELIKKMGGLDLIFISVTACDDIIKENDLWVKEKKTLDVDLVGFWVMARVALDHFLQQKSGHLAAISSIVGEFGAGESPAYSGSKAFISTYLEGVRNQMIKKEVPIYVTDVVAGYVSVESVDASLLEDTYWVITAEEAASQIYRALEKKQDVVYVSKQWELISALLKQNPDNIRRGLQSLGDLKKFVS